MTDVKTAAPLKTSKSPQKLILTGLMMALTTVATMAIAIPVPFTNGYIHLGDSMIFLSVLILGRRYGAVSAGIGSALADILLGFVNWAPWTLVIKGLMAWLGGLVIEKGAHSSRNTVIAALATGGLWGVFNLAVHRIIRFEAENNPAGMLNEEAPDLSQLGVFLEKVQGQLMIVALAIPAFLILIAILMRWKENLIIPIHQLTGMTLSGLWMVFGYYVAGGLMYGNFAVAAFSIPANMVQFVAGFLVASLLAAALAKTPAIRYFQYQPRLRSSAK